jgi:alanine dehydrogenase
MRADARLLLLDKHQVEQLLQPDDVLEAVREAFVLHSEGEGRVFPVVREALSTGGVFGIKSGGIPAQGVLGFKAAGFWPGNRQVGGEPHQATVMLIDPLTGRPLCLIDGNAITTQRTGAAGGLSLLQLARPGSTRLCLFGAGVQAQVQLEFALRLMPSLREVRYLTADGKTNAGFEAKFAGRSRITHTLDANAAVADSEVVITATPGKGPLFDAQAVQPGTHLTCVGADTKGKRELPDGLLARARLVVDDLTQARQIGETQWAPETPAIELGDLLTGKVKFTREPGDITVFDMTGLALQDLTVARLLYTRASAAGLGQSISWPW